MTKEFNCMIKKIFTFLALVIPLTLKAQIVYNNGAILTLVSGSSMKVNGSVQMQSGSTFSNNGVLTVTGNVVSNAAGVTSTGTLLFNGSSMQTLSGSQTFFAKDVVFNNAAGVTFASPLKVSGVVSFTSGIVSASSASAPLIITSTGSVSGAGNTSHVNGYVTKEGTDDFAFPTGDGSRFQPVNVTLALNSNGLTARYYGSDAGTAPFGTTGNSAVALESYNAGEYWDINPVGTATGKVTVFWDNYKSPVITNTALLTVAHKRNGSWLNEGAQTVTGTTASGSVKSASISNWSPFTLGTLPASVLPVRLISFTAKAAEQKGDLQWRIADANGFSHFEVERSADARNFEKVGKVDFSQMRQNYNYVDDALLMSIAYYRLKMVDLDGTWAYSRTELVRFVRNANSLTGYPNPFHGILTISSPILQQAKLLDITGTTIQEFRLQNGDNHLNETKLTSGTYLIRTENGETIKVVKQ